ncbi:hypothetical protein BBJ28_00009936 [Nothophytophthora sp. Chile5]|nr:hypothetical protein BBJ28_00009936 [Nothophytophthora sp. Chile5]
MLKHVDSHPLAVEASRALPLNPQALSALEDEYMRFPGGDGQAARAHAARKSAMLSLSPACSFEAFSLHFHLPLKAAAEKFGVRATAFKKRCRAIGIRHWPYRKVRSLKRSLQELHRCKEQAPLSGKQQIQYATFKRQLAKLMAPETYGLDASGRCHRQQLLATDEDEEEDDGDSDDGDDSFASQSPRFRGDAAMDCTVSPSDGSAKTFGDFIPAGPVHLRSIRRNQSTFLAPPLYGKSPLLGSGKALGLPGVATRLSSQEALIAYCTKQRLPFPAFNHFSQVYEAQGGGVGASSAAEKAAALVTKTSPLQQHRTTQPVMHYSRHYSGSEPDEDEADGDRPPSGSGLGNLPPEIKCEDVRSLNDADDEFTAHANHVDYSSERFFDDVFLQISPDYGCLV